MSKFRGCIFDNFGKKVSKLPPETLSVDLKVWAIILDNQIITG